jgi:hypothetical protein
MNRSKKFIALYNNDISEAIKSNASELFII